jgi:hypothetical protein
MTKARRRLAGLAALVVALVVAAGVARLSSTAEDVVPDAPPPARRAPTSAARSPTPSAPRRRAEAARPPDDGRAPPPAAASAEFFTMKVLRADGAPAARAQVTVFEPDRPPAQVAADAGGVAYAAVASAKRLVTIYATLGEESGLVVAMADRGRPIAMKLAPAVRVHVRVTEGAGRFRTRSWTPSWGARRSITTPTAPRAPRRRRPLRAAALP